MKISEILQCAVVTCDKCEKAMEVHPKEVICEADGIAICGEPVYVTAFMCPFCGKIYVSAVLTEKMKAELRKSLTKSEKKRLKMKADVLREKYIEHLKSGLNRGAEMWQQDCDGGAHETDTEGQLEYNSEGNPEISGK